MLQTDARRTSVLPIFKVALHQNKLEDPLARVVAMVKDQLQARGDDILGCTTGRATGCLLGSTGRMSDCCVSGDAVYGVPAPATC